MTTESSLRPYGNRQKWHLEKDGKANCLAVVAPEIAENWHPTKNAPLTPYDVTPKSNKKVWWQCPVEDIHVWDATVKNVANSTSEHACPYCTGKKVLPSFSLATRFPELASQWHKTKNKDLSPLRYRLDRINLFGGSVRSTANMFGSVQLCHVPAGLLAVLMTISWLSSIPE